MQKIFSSYKNLSLEVYRLAIVRFVLSMGNFIYPFMTLFLVKKLEITPHITSIFVISSGLMFVPASIFSGRLSDKIGRKFILLLSFVIYIALIFAIFFLYHFNILRNVIIAVLLIIANLFLSMTQVPIAAIITDVTNPSNRNESFSFVYLAANAGFAFGPLIAGFLFENYTSFIFLGNGIASLIGFLILSGIIETKPTDLNSLINKDNKETNFNDGSSDDKDIINLNLTDNSYKNNKEEISVLKFILGDRIFLIFILSTIFFSFAYSQAGFTLPIFLTKIFNSNGAKFYGILQSINALTVIFFTPLVSFLTKGKSAFLMVALAGVFYAFGFGLYSIFKFFPLFILTTIIWSTGEIIQVTHQNVFIANRSPINLRGQVNGTFQILSGIGFVLGPVFSGFFQKYFEVKYVWFVVFGICLIGVLQLFIGYKKNKNI